MRRLYRLALRLLPRAFRERNAEEMELLLAEALEGAGPLGRLRVAAAAFLDVLVVAVRTRRSRGGSGSGLLDLRHAARGLRRRRGFTAVAVTTIGLGMGAVAGVYGVLDAVLLRPLPYADADRIGILWHDLGGGAQSLPALHVLDILDYEAWSESFEEVTWATGREMALAGPGAPELVDVGFVDDGFFSFFGVEAETGRLFRPDEVGRRPAPVAILSHRAWEQRYGGDPGVLGSGIEVGGRSLEVVGVLPRTFRLHLPAEAFLLTDAEIWTPGAVDPDRLPPRNFTGFTGFVRLRPGVAWPAAQAELDAMAARLREAHGEHADSDTRARVVPLHEDVTKEVDTALWTVFGAVGLVLLVACANVAHLLLARGRSRRREIAVRAALGGRRSALARLVLWESVLIALAGGVLALGVAQALVAGLPLLEPGRLPRLGEARVDGAVLAFTLLLSTLTALVFGVLPALQASAVPSSSVLAAGGRGGGSRKQRRAQRVLVVAEVAVTLVLVSGAGLMLRSFLDLRAIRPGYDPSDALTFRVVLPGAYGPDERRSTARRLEERLAALPGARSATLVTQLPLTGSGPLQPFAYDEETLRNWESVTADERAVTPGFFEKMGAELVAGRAFTDEDAAGARPVVVIDDRLAERAFPGVDPVGRRLQIERDPDDPDSFVEVVGVVRHLRLHDLTRDHLHQIWLPYLRGPWSRFSMVVRADGDPAALAPHVRRVVAELDPELALTDLRPFDELVDGALARPRVVLALMAGFGALALLLSAVGVYGVLAYAVSRRTRELGIRMALGESPGRVRRAVLAEGMGLVGAALLLGALPTLTLAPLVRGLLVGVEPRDPWTLAVSAAVLAGAAALACWIPSRRATAVDPAAALRADQP